MLNDVIKDCIKLVGVVYIVGVVVVVFVGVLFGEDVYNKVCVVCYGVGVLGVFCL